MIWLAGAQTGGTAAVQTAETDQERRTGAAAAKKMWTETTVARVQLGDGRMTERRTWGVGRTGEEMIEGLEDAAGTETSVERKRTGAAVEMSVERTEEGDVMNNQIP